MTKSPAFFALALAMALACGPARFPAQERPRDPGDSLPFPQRPLVTEQVLMSNMPRRVVYTVHLPLGALKDYVHSLAQGRARLLATLAKAGRRLPPGMDPAQTSTPSLALAACWGAVEGKLADSAWTLIDFELSRNDKPENVRVLVVERAEGLWSTASGSDESKKGLSIVTDECSPRVITSLNSERHLILSAKLAKGDHFPADARHHRSPGDCWLSDDIREGTCLGLKGTVHTLVAASWIEGSRSHEPLKDRRSRKYLGGIGFVEGNLDSSTLKVIEIFDPGRSQGVTTMREEWLAAIRRFGEGLKSGSLTDEYLAAEVGYVMELIPSEAANLRKCLRDGRVKRDALEKAISAILGSLDGLKLVRDVETTLSGYLSK